MQVIIKLCHQTILKAYFQETMTKTIFYQTDGLLTKKNVFVQANTIERSVRLGNPNIRTNIPQIPLKKIQT